MGTTWSVPHRITVNNRRNRENRRPESTQTSDFSSET